jgi:glycosyltransferase involved in cell wall biosynthesis
MEKDILLTIAIPTYNNSNVLARAIESCQNQTDLTNCEIIVVNNASLDNTQNIIDQFKNSKLIKSYKLELKITQAANHNYCLNKSSGKYVLFCHSDDCLDIDAVKIVKKNLIKRQYPNKYIFWGHSMIDDYSYALEKYGLQVGRIFAGQRSALPHLAGGVPPSGTCYSKDMIDFGGFLESSHPLSPYDSSSMVFLALKGFRFEMIDDIIVHRVLASTHTANQKIKNLIASFADAYDVLRKKLSVNEKDRLFNSAIGYNHRPPLAYLYYESNFNPKKILIPLIMHSILRPWLLGKQLFWRTFFNVLLKVITNSKKKLT